MEHFIVFAALREDLWPIRLADVGRKLPVNIETVLFMSIQLVSSSKQLGRMRMSPREFNAIFPVGTQVRLRRQGQPLLKTRTRGIAFVSNGRGVVAVESIVGVVELAQLAVAIDTTQEAATA